MLPRVRSASKEKKLDLTAWQERERKFKLMRWAFFGTAAAIFGGYVYIAGIAGMYAQAIGTARRAIEEAERHERRDEDEDEDEDSYEDVEDEEDEATEFGEV
jgi:sorting and assembly machinery component 37